MHRRVKEKSTRDEKRERKRERNQMEVAKITMQSLTLSARGIFSIQRASEAVQKRLIG